MLCSCFPEIEALLDYKQVMGKCKDDLTPEVLISDEKGLWFWADFKLEDAGSARNAMGQAFTRFMRHHPAQKTGIYEWLDDELKCEFRAIWDFRVL